MRPSTDPAGRDVYECFACGSRVESPDTRACGECGGELNNLGTSRDV